MKMKNDRLLLWAVATASLILLTGFEKPGLNSAPSSTTTSASIEPKKRQSGNNTDPAGSTRKKTSNKQKAALRSKTNNDAELQKSLDLSIPFKDPENGWIKPEPNSVVKAEANMFAAEKKKKPRSLALDGQMLMSQEPEVDKKKSLDGAGIVINLKR